MDKTYIFTVSYDNKYFRIECKQLPKYGKFVEGVANIYSTMLLITDRVNNELNAGVLFEMA